MYIHSFSPSRARVGRVAPVARRSDGQPGTAFFRRTLWKFMLVAGALAIVAYYLMPTLVTQDAAYSAVGIGATVAIVAGVRIHRVEAAAGWYLVAAANACFVGGDAVLNLYDVVLHVAAPFPSSADVIYLAGYPLLFAGVRRIAPGRKNVAQSWTDATAVCVGTLGLLWHFLMGPTLAATTQDAGSGTLG